MLCQDMTREFLATIKKSMRNITDNALEEVVKFSRAFCRERETRELEMEQMEKSIEIFQRVLSKRSVLQMDPSCFCPSAKRPR
eukprot:2448044-Ditylum_brightwellii.AAC.1